MAFRQRERRRGQRAPKSLRAGELLAISACHAALREAFRQRETSRVTPLSSSGRKDF